MTAKRTNLIFSMLLAGAIVSSLLQTVLTSALPQIMRELNLSAATAQWLKGLVQSFTKSQTPKDDFDQVFFRSGIEAVISAWLAYNCQESPEFIEQIIESHHHI